MEKRFVLFFILSFVVIMLYPYVLERLGFVREPVIPEMTDEPPTETAPEFGEEFVESPQAIDLPPAEEQTIEVETDLYRARFSTRGATIVHWELKRYTMDNGESKDPIVLYSEGSGGIKPFSVETDDPDADERFSDMVYRLKGESIRLNKDNPSGTLSFIAEGQEGEFIRKAFTFSNDSYRVEATVEVGVPVDKYRVHAGTNFGIVDWGAQTTVGFIGPMVMGSDGLEKYKPGKIGPEQRFPEPPVWAGLADKYFIAVLIPEGSASAVVQETDDRSVDVGLEFPAPAPAKFGFYAGPKEFERLASAGIGLEKSIDFGWFMFGSWWLVRAIAEPLFHFLRFLYDYTGNYGVCIVLLTVVIRSLFIPLMHKSYKSMKAMKVLQPEMAALQKKHKNDKERLNRELMELYKKHGANPLGGCLPILVQLPVFIALFNVLNSTIELRQAPFLWIADLSNKDPIYVLPIIMGATMLIQQKIQPTAMDPRQARIFMFLPVFFTILFLNFPGGLVLYWLTNNLLTILQQYITMKYIDREPEEAK